MLWRREELKCQEQRQGRPYMCLNGTPLGNVKQSAQLPHVNDGDINAEINTRT